MRPDPLRCSVAAALLCAGASAQAPRDPLIGVVLTPRGEPVAGARVEAWRAEGDGTGLLDLAYKDDVRRVAAAPTDRRGRFALQLPAGLPCRIVVDHPPFAVWRRNECLPGLDLTVQLAEPAAFAGRMSLADGAPATGALRAWHPETREELLRGRTDEHGAFRFERLPPGPLRVELEPDVAPSPMWTDHVLQPGATAVHEVRLERGARLTGRVTDAATGAPIAGARIGEGWTMFRAVTTDDDGRYELRGAGSWGRRDLHCRAAGYVAQQSPPKDPAGGHVALDFRLVRGEGADGRVVDASGAPLAGVYVQVFGFARDDPGGAHDCIGLRTLADGTFETRGLRADVDHVIVVRRDGFAMLVYALPAADDDGVKRAGDITLPRARIVRGVVVGKDGVPLADAPVSLRGYNTHRNRLAPAGRLARGEPNAIHGEWGLLDHYVGRRLGRTDHLGRFAFGDVAAGTFHVAVLGRRNDDIGTSAAIEVAADADPDLVRIDVAVEGSGAAARPGTTGR